MHVKSLGHSTDLIFPRFEGEVHDRSSYLVVRSPQNPTYYWGNYLIFDRPPAPGVTREWLDAFRHEIGGPPGTEHVLVAWNDVDGAPEDLAQFEALGFEVVYDLVMCATELHAPPRVNTDAEVRTLSSDEDWAQALECQVAARFDRHAEGPYREFKQRQMARYRRMQDAGRGAWFGAFLDGRVVADLGVFHDGSLARYQAVGTHPQYRRRGLCGTLVWRAGQYAQAEWGVRDLVIVADEHDVAAGIYASVGFRTVERKRALLRYPTGG